MRDDYSLLPLRASSNFDVSGDGTMGNSLQVTNSLAVDAAAANAGTVAKTLRSSCFSGEGIASRRTATPLPSNPMTSSPCLLIAFGHREKFFSSWFRLIFITDNSWLPPSTPEAAANEYPWLAQPPKLGGTTHLEAVQSSSNGFPLTESSFPVTTQLHRRASSLVAAWTPQFIVLISFT